MVLDSFCSALAAFQFLNFIQAVDSLDGGTTSLNTGQHKDRTNRIHNHSVWVREDSSFLRPRHCDQHSGKYEIKLR
jgi:hypothetical protein